MGGIYHHKVRVQDATGIQQKPRYDVLQLFAASFCKKLLYKFFQRVRCV